MRTESSPLLYHFDRGCLQRGFPAAETALREPNGLLAAGGRLDSDTLLQAYGKGIFPWYEGSEPILWWTPDPRCVLYPEQVHVSRSLARKLKKKLFHFTVNGAFQSVIRACARSRDGEGGNWITPAMIQAYCRLHTLGHAHSLEIWHQHQLTGGIYGIAIGRVFFGESMFSARPDASKAALVCLAGLLQDHGFRLIDCQVASAHLYTMGAVSLPRPDFLRLLADWCAQTPERRLELSPPGAQASLPCASRHASVR